MNVTSLYPSTWPRIPFHDGEIQVQQRLGVHERVMTYGPQVIRPYLPDQHRDFYQNQPFLVAAARDNRGKLWSTLLFASNPKQVSKFISSPDPKTLVIESKLLPGDALEGSLWQGSDLGILGIEFATRRRNRVNGRILSNDGQKFEFKVDQSFGNCPQYIKPRDWWTATSKPRTSSFDSETFDCGNRDEASRTNQLTIEQIDSVQAAESVFLATGYRGKGEDPRFGNDASHRGGTPGFLRVSKDGKRLFLPDYAGNNMYQSVGNLMKDPAMGISVPLYEVGGMIQMTGRARVHWEDDEDDDDPEVSVSDFPAALRWIEFFIDEIVEQPAGNFPIRWDSGKREKQLQVIEKVNETDDVTSFFLAPLPGDSPVLQHKPGQHLTLTLPIAENSSISRSYSLSNYGQHQDYFRISVRRDPFGVGSRFLHDNVHVGDLLDVQNPAGSFTYDPSSVESFETSVLFLSAGIGVTPILSMLHAFVKRGAPNRSKRAMWVHSAKDGHHHAFKNEVEELRKTAAGALQTYVSYTRPCPEDGGSYDFKGRIDANMLSKIIPEVEAPTLKVFMCGPNGFISAMEALLQDIKVPLSNIAYESF